MCKPHLCAKGELLLAKGDRAVALWAEGANRCLPAAPALADIVVNAVFTNPGKFPASCRVGMQTAVVMQSGFAPCCGHAERVCTKLCSCRVGLQHAVVMQSGFATCCGCAKWRCNMLQHARGRPHNQHHTLLGLARNIYIYIYIYGVYTVLLAGESPTLYIRSYTVYIYTVTANPTHDQAPITGCAL